MPRERKGDFREYTENYKNIVKEKWYAAGRCDFSKSFINGLPEENGSRPSVYTIKTWRKNEMWDFWADELDSKALALAEENLIQQKVAMLKRHAETGWMLQTLGITHLVSGTFDSSASAVAAVIKGAQLERESRGMGEMMVKMAQMSDEKLREEITKRIQQAVENNQIVDAEELDTASTDDT